MTAQFSEGLIYEGKNFSLCSLPLSPYLSATGTQFHSFGTACYRGYIGTWEILPANDVERLYLINLVAYKTNNETVSLPDVFPGFERVFAHWFSGELRCPQGTQLKYVHQGYQSIYEYDLFLQFERGILVHKYTQHNHLPAEKKGGVPAKLLRKLND